MEREIEKYFLNRGQEIVDTLFDNGYFCEEVKREDLRNLDDLIGGFMQIEAESAVRCDRLTRKIRNTLHDQPKSEEA